MKKVDKFSSSSGIGKGKAATEEMGKKASHRTRIGMDFYPKTSRLCNQGLDKYLAKYGFA